MADGGLAAPGSELVEVWFQPDLLKALRGSALVPCKGVTLRTCAGGTFELGLATDRATCRMFYRWPVCGPDAHLLEIPISDDPLEVDG